VDAIAGFMQPFGFGQPTGIDLQGELRGVLPSTEWKRKAYRRPEQQRWYAGETISLGIGQGYNNFTIMQLANALATLSTGGQRHTPHLVRDVVDVVSGVRHPVAPTPLEPLQLNPEFVDVIRNAMVGVNKEGTGKAAFAGAGYVSAGKTGTAQVASIKANEKYNAAKVAEYLRDNALFISFAPADKPTIAIALVVENVSGFGAQYAGPIARRVMDYWIKGVYPTDEDIAAVQQGIGGAPKTAAVPIALATNIRLGTNHAPGADDAAIDAAEAASAASAAAAASRDASAVAPGGAASQPSAAERAAAAASAASAARAAAVEAARANAGAGAVAVAGSAAAKRLPSPWTPTPAAGKHPK